MLPKSSCNCMPLFQITSFITILTPWKYLICLDPGGILLSSAESAGTAAGHQSRRPALSRGPSTLPGSAQRDLTLAGFTGAREIKVWWLVLVVRA